MPHQDKDRTALTKDRKFRLRKPVSHDIRPRNYLTPEQVKSVTSAAGASGRHRRRDSTLIQMMFRHGLRALETSTLQWQQVDFKSKTLFITLPDIPGRYPHPLDDTEIATLRQLKEKYPDSDYVFVSELKKPLTTDSIRRIVVRAGQNAGLDFLINPHMLRNSAFYYLQQQGMPIPMISQYLRVGIKTTARVISEYAQDTSFAQDFAAIQWDV